MLRVVQKSCLVASYQPKITIAGIRTLLQKCPNIIELEMGEVSIGPQHIASILTIPKKLLYFLCGRIGDRASNSQEQLAIQNAVRATKGRVVACTLSGGRVPVNLSSEHKKNQDESMAKVERAHEQQYDPMICNKWDGII